MRYPVFGRSGIKVSELCLGAMTFGEEWGWGSNAKESRAIFDAFVEAGGNFIDTADVYTGGTSERLLGELIASERDRFVVSTKFTAGPGARDPNAAGNSRKNMRRALEASLRRLRTDYVDVYWVHVWDFLTPIEEVMQSLDDLVREGKVHYVGLSDAPAWVVARAQTMAELRGWAPLSAIQVLYSLSERSVEGEFLPMADALDLAVCCWSPLDQGLLTGKFSQGSPAGRDSERSRLRGEGIPEEKRSIVDALERVAAELGSSPAQVALRWLRMRSPRAIPIVGARTLAQLRDNLGAIRLEIPEPLFERLERASRRPLAWPHEMFGSPAQTGFTYGGFLDRIETTRPFPVCHEPGSGPASYVAEDAKKA
ncbi:MAG: aldo/keto reductase [Spirochaetaceae bacterium]|nr:aldo/keto reductase [Spirochaetaceae bacterium]HPG24586.1 aldo/keto reductase [Myxococcota bacterium]